MFKVFNDSLRKFQLEAQDGEVMIVPPGKFVNIDDKFEADVTFRVAVAGGDLKVYDDVRAAEKLIREHEERPVEEPEVPVTIETARSAKKQVRKAE